MCYKMVSNGENTPNPAILVSFMAFLRKKRALLAHCELVKKNENFLKKKKQFCTKTVTECSIVAQINV
jgi:hypothetical protein